MKRITIRTNQNVCLFTNEELFLILDGLRSSQSLLSEGGLSEQSENVGYLADQICKLNIDQYKRIA